MGIKALKKQFNIGHIVQRRDGKILIGSPYVSDLISIKESPECTIKKSNLIEAGKDELGQIYSNLIDCDKARLLSIISETEIPVDPKPVYTEETRGRVIKAYCEEYGWPNLTTAGVLMNDNSYYQKRSDALKHAQSMSLCEIKWIRRAATGHAVEMLGETKEMFLKLLCLARLYIFRGH